MRTRNYLTGGAVLMLTLAISTTASAAAISGIIYENDPTSSNAAVVPSGLGLPSANFTVTNINFTSPPGAYTPMGLLNQATDGFSGFTNLQNGFDPNQAFTNSFIQLTGIVYLNAGSNAFTLGHDDGAVLTINGVSPTPVVNQPSTAQTVSGTLTAPSNGGYSFVLNFADSNPPNAGLILTINGAAPVLTPEPSTMLLFGSGLVGLALFSRRSFQRKA